MAPSNMPLATLVSLFLAIFVLIGIQPAIKRTAQKIRKHLDAAKRVNEPLAPSLAATHDGLFGDPSGLEALNDFEIIVLRRIAQADGTNLSRKQINEPLLFGEAVLNRTLRSLSRRRLVSLRVSKLFGQRFALTEAGRRYALKQGYIVQIQERTGLI